MDNETEWAILWQAAWIAHQDYITKGNDTLQLLSNIEFPVTLEKREEILRQRRIENEARERMQVARNDLFDALKRLQFRSMRNVKSIRKKLN